MPDCSSLLTLERTGQIYTGSGGQVCPGELTEALRKHTRLVRGFDSVNNAFLMLPKQSRQHSQFHTTSPVPAVLQTVRVNF